MFKSLVFVFLGGGIGCCFRFLIALFFQKTNYSFPLPTFIANFLGCLLIGFFVGYFDLMKIVKMEYQQFMLIGVLGGLTTFSTFSVENIRMLQTNTVTTSLFYTIATIIVCFMATVLGLWLAKLALK